MKMTKPHRAHIREEIQKFRDRSVPYLADVYKAKGLTHKRFRWDLLWSAVGSQWISDNLYPYINDDHIDTALRSIVKPYSQLTVIKS